MWQRAVFVKVEGGGFEVTAIVLDHLKPDAFDLAIPLLELDSSPRSEWKVEWASEVLAGDVGGFWICRSLHGHQIRCWPRPSWPCVCHALSVRYVRGRGAFWAVLIFV